MTSFFSFSFIFFGTIEKTHQKTKTKNTKIQITYTFMDIQLQGILYIQT